MAANAVQTRHAIVQLTAQLFYSNRVKMNMVIIVTFDRITSRRERRGVTETLVESACGAPDRPLFLFQIVG